MSQVHCFLYINASLLFLKRHVNQITIAVVCASSCKSLLQNYHQAFIHIKMSNKIVKYVIVQPRDSLANIIMSSQQRSAVLIKVTHGKIFLELIPIRLHTLAKGVTSITTYSTSIPVVYAHKCTRISMGQSLRYIYTYIWICKVHTE